MKSGFARKITAFGVLAVACAPIGTGCGGAGDEAFEGDGVGADFSEVGIAVPSTLGLDKSHKLYLTFDDGPHAVNTPKVLDVLKKHGVTATFFITGTSISGNESLIRREIAEGHLVGNHQYKHEQASNTNFNVWVPMERDWLYSITSVKQPYYFRYPYGAGTSTKEAVLKTQGYVDGGIGWDIDTDDWCFADGYCDRTPGYPTDYKGWVYKEAKRVGGGVMLFHDIQSITAANIDTIITQLKADGFTFGALPTTIKTGMSVSTWVGDACVVDADCTFTGGLCNKKSGATLGTCTEVCTHSCPDQSNEATTFCITDPDNASRGICVPKASSTYNLSCATYAGRLSYKSSVYRPDRSSSATVCSP